MIVDSVLANLAVTDPVGAFSLALESGGDGNTRSRRIVELVGRLAESDPDRALALLLEVDDYETERINGLSRLGAAVGARDPVAGMEMLARLTDQDRDTFFGSLNLEVAKRNPHLAAEYFETYLDGRDGVDGWHLDSFALQVAANLVRVDPPAAMEWAERLPEGVARERALKEVRDEWERLDETALKTK